MHLTVSVIFEDPGVQELLVKLYQKGKILYSFHCTLIAIAKIN